MRAIEVFTFLNGISRPEYEKYIKRLDHCKGTHGYDSSLLLSKAKSEAGKKHLHSWVLRFLTNFQEIRRFSHRWLNLRLPLKILILTFSI